MTESQRSPQEVLETFGISNTFFAIGVATIRIFQSRMTLATELLKKNIPTDGLLMCFEHTKNEALQVRDAKPNNEELAAARSFIERFNAAIAVHDPSAQIQASETLVQYTAKALIAKIQRRCVHSVCVISSAFFLERVIGERMSSPEPETTP